MDPANNTNRFLLQYFYLPEINEKLSYFRRSWNCHKIKTERNRTPRKIWIDGMLCNINSRQTSVREIFTKQPNLFFRVRDALINLGINLNEEVIDLPDEQSSLTAVYNLSQAQQQLLDQIDGQWTTAKEKYLAALTLF